MKSKLLLLLCMLPTFTAFCQYTGNAAAGSGSAKLESTIDSLSYCFGVDIANSIKNYNIKQVNLAAFADGFQSIMNSDTANLKVNEEDARLFIMEYLKKVQEATNEKNKKEGEAFLAKNSKNPGVKVTSSGLQYIVLKEGKGAVPVDTSKVRVHYHGTLIDGTVFESSLNRGAPAEFPVNRVIKGWQEALKMMHVGSKWKVFIPQELGYGANMRPGGKIEPYMTLIFEIELLDILSK